MQPVPDRVNAFQCGIFDRTFAIYSSLVSFFIPLSLKLFADLRSVHILRRNVHLQRAVGGSQRRGGGTSSVTTLARDSTIQSLQHETTHGEVATPTATAAGYNTDDTASLASGLNTTSVAMNAQHTIPTHGQLSCGSSGLPSRCATPEPPTIASGRFYTSRSEITDFAAANGDRDHIQQSDGLTRPVATSVSVELTRPGCSRQGSRRYAAIRARRAASTAKKTAGRERRAERTLIYVFVCFVVFWLPFFCTNFLYGVCAVCAAPEQVFLAFSWLGYASSGINPCIYTLLNRDFRRAFKNIATCRLSGSALTGNQRRLVEMDST